MLLNNLGNNKAVITKGNTKLFFSYSTLIMAITPTEVLVTKEKYSKTTSRHLNQFLGDLTITKKSRTEGARKTGLIKIIILQKKSLAINLVRFFLFKIWGIFPCGINPRKKIFIEFASLTQLLRIFFNRLRYAQTFT